MVILHSVTGGAAGRVRAHLDTAPIANQSERGVYAASTSASRPANRIVRTVRTLKRPEGRAPGAVSRCAPGFI
jgi:hypothetical protein